MISGTSDEPDPAPRDESDPGEAASEEVRRALRQLASGVSVVTTAHQDELYGITVTSFTSISLEPPVVLVALNNESSMSNAVVNSGRFAVHVLSAEQRWLSERFASSASAKVKYEGITLTYGPSGSPRIPATLASFDCIVVRTVVIGTHTVVFGRVVEATSLGDPGDPLLHFHRDYWRLEATAADDDGVDDSEP